jgi:predicted MFS family arabinose efflux permease
MNRENIILFIVNGLSATGYSLMAPLYPSLAKERGIEEDVIGMIIAIFAVANFIATPFCPKLIQKTGRKNLLYFAICLEVD